MNNLLYNGFHKVERLIVNIKGKTKTIEKLGIKNAVAAIVTDKEGKIGIVIQHRPCVNKILYEIPAGLKDKEGKSEKEILIEELEEECEINRNSIKYFSEKPIQTYYMLSGSSDAEISIYRVRLDSIEHTKEVSDEDVDRVEWLSFNEFQELRNKGLLNDAKTLMAYYILENENNKNNEDNIEIDVKNEPYLKTKQIQYVYKYNPAFGDDRICECGHSYYRHFDSYEDMEAVGCKYCGCSEFKEKKKGE